jgi:hypothetical protein
MVCIYYPLNHEEIQMSNIFSRIVLASFAVLATVGTASANTPDKYIGVTLDDDADVGLVSKLQVKQLGKIDLSVRPQVTFGSNANITVPVTADYSLTDKLDLYAGVGANVKTVGTDDYGVVGLVGADFAISKKLVLNGSYKFGNTESAQIGLGFGF